MSRRYKGAIISATPPTTSLSTASGSWTLQQQMQAQAAGAWPVGGPFYIEDVFSSYLYTGNGTTQTITNNIDLSTKGGMVWTKDRSNIGSNLLFDTARGATVYLSSNTNTGNTTSATTLTSFNTTGFAISSNTGINTSNDLYASWAFREQVKFFDVVTYTGTGSATTVAHNLGAAPGCIMVKRTDTTGNWVVYHRSVGNTGGVILNSTAGTSTSSTYWNNTDPTSSVFTVGTNIAVNASGGTYVAYVFAHDAGGFGLTGTDNVISCGSYTGNGSATGPTVTLGYEPQWVLIRNVTSAGYNWTITDNMRGFTAGSAGGITKQLFPNTTAAEANFYYVQPQATGFQVTDTSAGINGLGDTYIYIAIRRGPMKVPTDATKVFLPTASSDGTGTQITTGFPVSMQMSRDRSNNDYTDAVDRMRGISTNTTEEAYTLETSSTVAESYTSNLALSWGNTGFKVPNTYGFDPKNAIYWSFQRAPQFFDEVCYTGTGSATTVTHNLGAVPELMIVKSRSTAVNWPVYASATGNTQAIYLNTTGVPTTNSTFWNNTSPTSTQFTVGSSGAVNGTSVTYVAYLFATCAGVSKVGSYTGTGTLTTINCGFTGGARFVLIKRTDSTSDWYVWDTARGMTAGTDYSLSLNTISAQVNANSVYTITTGFQLLASPSADVNTNGGTYIYLAIA